MARLKNLLPVRWIDLHILWNYVLGQDEHLTNLAERVERLEAERERE